MTEKLKACPFCGGKADLQYRKGDYAGSYVSCHTEDCCGNPSDDSFSFVKEEYAIKAWNTRPTAPKCCDAVGKEYCWRNDCAAEDCKMGEAVTDDALREAVSFIRIFCGVHVKNECDREALQERIEIITHAIKGQSK